MNKFLSYFKNFNWLLIGVLYLMLLSVFSMAGIAYQTVTTTTRGMPGTNTVTVESNESRGVIGSAFHLVGQVLVFPFRVIGSIF